MLTVSNGFSCIWFKFHLHMQSNFGEFFSSDVLVFFCLARFQILGTSKRHDKFARSSCVYQLTYIGQIHNKAVRYEEK